MTKVEEIEHAIDSLPAEEYRRFRQWFVERDWLEWDHQTESDSESGKLDFLLQEAAEEKRSGKLKDL